MMRLQDSLYKEPVLGCAVPLSPCLQVFKGKRDSMPPHICSLAQRAYRNLLLQRQDQAIVPLGRSGAGKTTCCQSALEYLVGTAGSLDGTVSGMGLGGHRKPRSQAGVQRALGLQGAWHWAVSAQRPCRLESAHKCKGDAVSIQCLHLAHSWDDSCPIGVAWYGCASVARGCSGGGG